MLVRKKLIALVPVLAVFGMACPQSVSRVLAEDLLSGQPFRQNEAALSGVQEVAPSGPANEEYDLVRSASLNIESELPSTVALGQTVSVKLTVTPGETAINVAKASLAYSSDTLKLVAVDGESSPFSMIFDDQAGVGEVTVTAMRPAPGISAKAQVAELYFIAMAAGEARIDFQPDSVVLANDGYGSDVLASAQGLVFGISEY